MRVRLEWSADRARRFVQVVDKLFTVDRLGWYRHVIAMRLLVPDQIVCGDDGATIEAARHLRSLRAATTETLGRPLLAAFMPNFSVTPEWLEAIETPAIARALAELRESIAPHASDAELAMVEGELDETSSAAILRRNDLAGAAASTNAFIAVLVPTQSRDIALAGHLDAYRTSLADVFAQTARSADAIRLGRMSEPNHVLDDRLWQLVGFVGAKLGAAAELARA